MAQLGGLLPCTAAVATVRADNSLAPKCCALLLCLGAACPDSEVHPHSPHVLPTLRADSLPTIHGKAAISSVSAMSRVREMTRELGVMIEPNNPILTKMLDRLFAAMLNGPSMNCRPHASRQ